MLLIHNTTLLGFISMPLHFRSLRTIGATALAKNKRYYAPISRRTASSDVSSSPTDILNSLDPKDHNYILSSIIDGELDYDSDLGAASVNNVNAKIKEERGGPFDTRDRIGWETPRFAKSTKSAAEAANSKAEHDMKKGSRVSIKGKAKEFYDKH